MTSKFHAEGDAVDYTPPAAMAAGDAVKFGTFMGVANNDIEANRKGALRVAGIFRIDAIGGGGFGASVPQPLGAELDFDFTSQSVQLPGGGDADVKVFMAETVTETTKSPVQVWINKMGG